MIYIIYMGYVVDTKAPALTEATRFVSGREVKEVHMDSDTAWTRYHKLVQAGKIDNGHRSYTLVAWNLQHQRVVQQLAHHTF